VRNTRKLVPDMVTGMRQVAPSMIEAAVGADVLLVSAVTTVLGYQVAEGMGVPSIGTFLLPTYLKHIPVIVLTTSDDGGDILRSYQLHANAYVTNPMDFNAFAEAIRQINFFVSVVNSPASHSAAVDAGGAR
jgi:CheY-like chemotaxis protein